MTHDAVNRPSHYAEGRQYEPIAVIEDWQLGYHLGNALKYISRAGRKLDTIEDLRKAVWYLERHIEVLQDQTCTIESENANTGLRPGCVDLYQEIQNMHYSDANVFNIQIPDVDDSTLDYWAEDSVYPGDNVDPKCTAWDSDDSYMIEPDECGWDPSTGPTC